MFKFYKRLKLYKSLGEYKTYIEETKSTLNNGEVIYKYEAKCMNDPWVSSFMTHISSEGLLRESKYQFISKEQAQRAIDNFIKIEADVKAFSIAKQEVSIERYP